MCFAQSEFICIYYRQCFYIFDYFIYTYTMFFVVNIYFSDGRDQFLLKFVELKYN